MKKLLYITKNFPPEIGGGLRRIEAIYNILLKNQKIELEVVTAQTNKNCEYKNVRYIKQLFFKDREKQEITNFDSSKSSIKLFDKAFIGWFPNVIFHIIFRKYDYILAPCPHFTNVIIGFIYKLFRFFRPRLIIEYRDFFSFNPSFNESFKKKILKVLEKIIIKSSNYIITTTDSMRSILNNYTNPGKIFLVRNYISRNDKQAVKNLKEMSFNKNYYHIGHVGKLNVGRNPVKVLTFLNNKISDKNIALHFVGVNENERKMIIELCNKMKLDEKRLFFYETVDRKKSLQYMKSFDGLILIVNNIALIKDGYGIPGKLYDYIAVNNNIFLDKDGFNNICSEFNCNKKNEFDNFINFSINDNETLDNVFNKVLDKIITND